MAFEDRTPEFWRQKYFAMSNERDAFKRRAQDLLDEVGALRTQLQDSKARENALRGELDRELMHR